MRRITACLGITAWSKLGYSNSAPEVTGNFLNWVSSNDERPFFAFLNYMEAHNPYLPPKRYDGMFGATPQDDYEECIAYLDEEGRWQDEWPGGERSPLPHRIRLIFSDGDSIDVTPLLLPEAGSTMDAQDAGNE